MVPVATKRILKDILPVAPVVPPTSKVGCQASLLLSTGKASIEVNVALSMSVILTIASKTPKDDVTTVENLYSAPTVPAPEPVELI